MALAVQSCINYLLFKRYSSCHSEFRKELIKGRASGRTRVWKVVSEAEKTQHASGQSMPSRILKALATWQPHRDKTSPQSLYNDASALKERARV